MLKIFLRGKSKNKEAQLTSKTNGPIACCLTTGPKIINRSLYIELEDYLDL